MKPSNATTKIQTLRKAQSQPPLAKQSRQIGLESPISFADLLQASRAPTEPPSLHDLYDRNDSTDDANDNNSNQNNNNNSNNSLSLSVTKTKSLLQVSDIDGDLLESTIDSFCRNLKQSVEEQFISSRERLFRQSENEINSVTKIYQNTLNDKEKELNKLKIKTNKLNEEYNNLKVNYTKIETMYSETQKKLSSVRHLSQTVNRWKNDCDKKKFILNFINKRLIPHKRKMKLQKLYIFWKNKSLTQHNNRYDKIWEKRLETVSKKIIEQYELSINNLRDQLNVKNYELEQLKNDRQHQQKNMKRAFMRGISAMNLEAMQLFDAKSQQMNQNQNKNTNNQHS